ncbi:MAG: hypothetical protein GC158_12135 [Cyanobacteria bacterium RI_101]|nr:hypothetical protein [Cyanobacteria bacterium RI_101]
MAMMVLKAVAVIFTLMNMGILMGISQEMAVREVMVVLGLVAELVGLVDIALYMDISLGLIVKVL